MKYFPNFSAGGCRSLGLSKLLSTSPDEQIGV